MSSLVSFLFSQIAFKCDYVVLKDMTKLLKEQPYKERKCVEVS